jgi:hypothetical protein
MILIKLIVLKVEVLNFEELNYLPKKDIDSKRIIIFT